MRRQYKGGRSVKYVVGLILAVLLIGGAIFWATQERKVPVTVHVRITATADDMLGEPVDLRGSQLFVGDQLIVWKDRSDLHYYQRYFSIDTWLHNSIQVPVSLHVDGFEDWEKVIEHHNIGADNRLIELEIKLKPTIDQVKEA